MRGVLLSVFLCDRIGSISMVKSIFGLCTLCSLFLICRGCISWTHASFDRYASLDVGWRFKSCMVKVPVQAFLLRGRKPSFDLILWRRDLLVLPFLASKSVKKSSMLTIEESWRAEGIWGARAWIRFFVPFRIDIIGLTILWAFLCSSCSHT